MTDLTQSGSQQESTLTLRDYRPSDWKAMHALDVLCFAPPFRFSRRAMREFAEAAGAITLLAEADGLLAGFCIVQIEPRTGYLVTLDVAPPHRRNGLARRLMHHIEARAAAAGADSMALHVFSGNTAAVSLYEALGYQQSAPAPNFYAPGLDALLYRKPLDPSAPPSSRPEEEQRASQTAEKFLISRFGSSSGLHRLRKRF